MLNKY